MREERAWIAMDDGVRLSVSLFHPDSTTSRPAILEALPYRKDDGTASYRAEYARLADEGRYTVARVDVRGTGSSEGVALDEYTEREQRDLEAVIAWLAAAPWSSGSVGMYGTSYSGFNSLQLAARRPAALAAVIAIYATDDRYTDDVHYSGGAFRQLDLLDYVHYMTALNALPPVPAIFGEGWEAAWRERVDATEPWLFRWLEEQHDSDYWRNGSLRAAASGSERDHGYERISCATMIVAGWADGYRNNSLRTFERLRCPKSLLFGPWSHMSPATSLPGPHIDLVPEMVRWWDRWLRNDPHTDATIAPIRVFMRRFTQPAADLAVHEGTWRAEDAWPPAAQRQRNFTSEAQAQLSDARDIGSTAWISCAGALPWGQPTDQRADDARSHCVDWQVDGELHVLGTPRVALDVRASAPVAFLSAKLCEVDAHGTSALISRGFLNLTCRDSMTEPQPLEPDHWYRIDMELDVAGWTFPAASTLRLALAGTDWPNVLPPPVPVTLDVRDIVLSLPCVEAATGAEPTFATAPVHGRSGAPSAAEQPPVIWAVEPDTPSPTRRARIDWGVLYEGECGARCRDHYAGSVCADGTAEATVRNEISWPDANVSSEARLRFAATATAYEVEIDLDTMLDGERFVERRWTRTFTRHLQ